MLKKVQLSNGICVTVSAKRIRNMYIKVTRDGQAVASVPRNCSETWWREHLEARAEWIASRLKGVRKAAPISYEDGSMHTILGRPVVLHVQEGGRNGCRLTEEGVVMTVHSEKTDRQALLAGLWKAVLSQEIDRLLDQWEPRMGVESTGYTIRRLKSRWGSCDTRFRDQVFSLDLASKPFPCIELVVVHELNHLIEKPHSARFHALMTHWLPDWKERTRALALAPREF